MNNGGMLGPDELVDFYCVPHSNVVPQLFHMRSSTRSLPFLPNLGSSKSLTSSKNPSRILLEGGRHASP